MQTKRQPVSRSSASRGRRGQTVVFLLMALTVLVFVFLWNVDLHRIVSAKSLSQNAGDAAALAAARWQGISLNLLGELNLMHALALGVGDETAVDAITNIQARLCFTGPMTALVAAQVAAKNNRIYAHDDFTRILRDHAVSVSAYDTLIGGAAAYPEPYPGAWQEYSDMLLAAADDGVAAAPDNARFYGDGSAYHILRDPAFYDAVAGRIWCWFLLHHASSRNPPRTILDDYTGYQWWPDMPPPDLPSFHDSEIFGLGVTALQIPLERIATSNQVATGAAQQAGLDAGPLGTNTMECASTWYVYDRRQWRAWAVMDPRGDEPFPIVGPVKPEYDYTGADAVVRLMASVERLTPLQGRAQTRDDILWTAAAKPFGYLETAAGGNEGRLRPDAYGMVLPAFRDVRLIPVDAASGGASGRFDLAWRRHLDEHLPLYLSTGQLRDDCRYCRLLNLWDNADFRREGVEWLLEFGHLCTLPGGGGGGSGGGTRRGH